jgi:glycosyltransferase involved in cell wall biosynthesis
VFNKTSKISVVMITLNEAHNLDRIINNIKSWVNEIFILDSFSNDRTIDIALSNNIKIYQNKFIDFGSQWNLALEYLPIQTEWVMKVDPDEFVTDDLKKNIDKLIQNNSCDAIEVTRRLMFIDNPINIKNNIVRVWKNGFCKFTDVKVNEHPIIEGVISRANGFLEHFDSPNIHHWIIKQNYYSSLEAKINYSNLNLADKPNLFGNSFQRRMWLKKNFFLFPFRYFFLFLYFYIYLGSFISGKPGYLWSKMKTDFMKFTEFKIYEMRLKKDGNLIINNYNGVHDKRVPLLFHKKEN